MGGAMGMGAVAGDGEERERVSVTSIRTVEEAGITVLSWRSLGSYPITLSHRPHPPLPGRSAHLGTAATHPERGDFKLMWWPMRDAIQTAIDGRFLLQGGPLALLLAQEAISLRGER
ncbi:hypothetical protein GCM10017771_72230 [Streptomyces capitiformicae]|uniref:Uncharacterized protein n=2 Tax=Streptomyces capitiformicae TaxID=2014920 RepID=A0A918ZFL5_9ACTN|nr:hypothetical protein GCM10017771_72230 [Streptomyces capitiformicae]